MENKQPGRWASFLLLAGCALPILLMLIVPFRGQVSISEAENRSLAQFPALTLESFLSGDFQQQLEDALGDQYPFGETLKGSLISLEDRIYQAESRMLHALFPSAAMSYAEIANGYYHFGGDESRIVEKAWLQEKYAPAVSARAAFYAGAEAPVYLYFIRNSRAHDFMQGDGENDAVYQTIVDAYQPAGAACFAAADYDAYASLFYATDHHWNHVGADRGYREIIRLLLGENEETLPVKAEVSFPVRFNGSYARQSGRMLGEDSFTVYTYDVKKAITRLNGKNGTYGHQALYEKGRYPTDELRNHYAYYYGGDYGEIVIQTRRAEKQNLLMMADSYSNPINGLIAAHFNSTHIIDLRYYERDMGKEFDLNAYIRDNDIDLVLLMGDITFFAGMQDGGEE